MRIYNKPILLMFAIFFAVTTSTLFAQKISQPTIIVLPKPEPGGKTSLELYNENDNVRSMNGAIEQVLVQHQMEVKNLKSTMQSFEKLRAKHSVLNTDNNAILAANSGSDLYIEYSYNILSEGAGYVVRIDLTSYEVCTSKTLGSTNGTSKRAVTTDIQGLGISAVNSCIGELLNQIGGYWKDIEKTGKAVYIAVISENTDLNKPNNGQKSISDAIFEVIQENAITFTEFQSAPNLYILNPVYVDIHKFSSLRPLRSLIEKVFYDMNIEYKSNMEGRLIEIEIN